MGRTRSGAYQPLAPISLAGHTSRTESVLFYTRGEQERPEQLIREPGTYRFALRVEEATTECSIVCGHGAHRRLPSSATFAAMTPEPSIRPRCRFYAKDWRSAMNQTAK
jgi:hypothetical protein